MRTTIVLSFCLGVLAASNLASACDAQTGERGQHVDLRWNHQPVGNWIAASSEIKRIDLPNGFALGVKIEPATAEKYAQLKAHSKHQAELVHISLYDMAGAEPTLLTHTWGGSNSLQGYGAKGGADRVEPLGTPGILLTLLKPVCADAVTSAQH